MQALFDTYTESRKIFRAAVLRYHQDLSDSQFRQLMGDAEVVLANTFVAYADIWWASPPATRAGFPNPNSIE